MGTSQTLTRVKVKCPCGKSYRCKPEIIGRKVKCRACKEPLILRPAEESKPRKAKECPDCTSPLHAGADFCLNCGFDLVTGEHVMGLFDAPAPPPARTSVDPNAAEKYWQPDPPPRPKPPEDDSRFDAATVKRPPVDRSVRTAVIVGMLLVALSVGLSMLGITGRWFLAFYGFVLAACWTYSEMHRQKNWRVMLVAASCFITVGVLRYVYGINNGMERFVLLFVMMGFGGLAIALGIRLFSKDKIPDEVVNFAMPPGISFLLTAGCLLWTVIQGLIFLPVFLLLAIFGGGGRYRRRGWFGGYGSGCGGGCGGGGCGGCGG